MFLFFFFFFLFFFFFFLFFFFFFEIKYKWRSFEKKMAIYDLLFTFYSHQGKDTKIPSAPISHIHTGNVLTIDFFALPILQKLRIYHVWFLFGRTPSVDSHSRHFGAINN